MIQQIGNATLYRGLCLEFLRELKEASVDAIVCDPPYGLSFMGKRWDYDVPSVDVWAECLRVLKPGGHLLAFAGTRTQHRMAVRIEDAGFEMRDMVLNAISSDTHMQRFLASLTDEQQRSFGQAVSESQFAGLLAWVYGSGFPKSLDVSKAIDKAAGAEREKVLVPTRPGNTRGDRGVSYAGESFSGFTDISEPVSDAARQWQGWGTALKPALEPITLARKPLSGTVAENVLRYGTGGLNIDGCRVGDMVETWPKSRSYAPGQFQPGHSGDTQSAGEAPAGRWPANLIHDGSEEVVGLFPQATSNTRHPSGGKIYGRNSLNESATCDTTVRGFTDSGSAARFFYCAKASKRDRDEGLEHMEAVHRPNGNKWTDQDYRVARGERPPSAESGPRRNVHPTVKPTDLMRYLCRLVTPPGGVVLDPFMGSGSTGKAAALEGFRFIGCECESEYFDIACRRIELAYAQGKLFQEPAQKPEQVQMWG